MRKTRSSKAVKTVEQQQQSVEQVATVEQVQTVSDNSEAIAEFAVLETVRNESESIADFYRSLAYEQDLQAHNANIALRESVQASENIASAQLKRNMQAETSTTSKFCRLLESNKQNYRIDRALESFHTMKEIMQLCDVSEARVKSHIKYIQTNCSTHCKLEVDSANKKFRFVLIHND